MRGFQRVNVSIAFIAPSVLLPGLAWAGVLLQSDSRARFAQKNFAYFFIEAEDFHDNNPRGDGESWILSSDPAALNHTVNDVDLDPVTGDPIEPDPGAFASGDESITNVFFQSTVTNQVGGGHDFQYLLRFDTPGTYHLYMRHHSPLGPELDRNKNDSFYYPVEFGESPTQFKANGDDYGFLESMEFPGDVRRRGPWIWFAARTEVENSEQNPPVDQDPALFREYVITPEMVGQDLVLEFDHRETGTMLDAFLFIETSSGLPPTNGEGPDGLGFFGVGDAVDIEFGLSNLGMEAPPKPPRLGFARGDADSNGKIELTDGIVTLTFLFVDSNTKPACFDAADTDDDGALSITDGIRVFQWLFVDPTQIPLPPSPRPGLAAYEKQDCGEDPSAEDPDLGCETVSMICQ